MASEILVNNGSGNGLLPDGTKPLPDPMLTNHQWSLVTFISGQFHEMLQPSITKICLEIACLKFHSNLPGGQWVKVAKQGYFNPSGAGPLYIQDPNLVIPGPVYVIAPGDARASAGTLTSEKLPIYSSEEFLCLSMIPYHLHGLNDHLQNSQGALMKERHL